MRKLSCCVDLSDLLFPFCEGAFLTGPVCSCHHSSIRSDDDGYVVQVPVPGYDKDEIEITLQNGVLTIKGISKQKSDSLRHDFVAHIDLDGDIDGQGVRAELDKGILTIRVPFAESNKPIKIKID